jgi:hypothetical protein
MPSQVMGRHFKNHYRIFQAFIFKKRRRKINLVEDLYLHEALALDEVIKLYDLI